MTDREKHYYVPSNHRGADAGGVVRVLRLPGVGGGAIASERGLIT